MIPIYFDQVKAVIDKYAATGFVLETNVNFERRPGDQGFLNGVISFVEGSQLHFSEFLDQVGENVEKLMYTYHYQDSNKSLIFRYDNARHKPALPSPEHKHLPNQIIITSAPDLDDVLTEIVTMQKWV
ncbi:MAG: hypothetical protein KDJ65_10385 [Anaerolineae bacterium]|nr:hypothetical protein [Anaerolineae bacterium]